MPGWLRASNPLEFILEDSLMAANYTARVTEDERRHRPRLNLEFGVDGTLIGSVVRARELGRGRHR